MASEDEDRGPLFLGIFTSGTIVAIIVVALRFWVRARIVCKIRWDDWIMLASLVLNLGAYGCLTASVQYGLGRHYRSLSFTDSRMALKLLWSALCMTPSAEATAKISISMTLIHITTSTKWKRFFYTTIILFVLITIMTLFGVLLPCQPVELLWDRSVDGSCDSLAESVIFYIQGVSAALYDTILATSPIVLLWNVQIDVRKKLLVCGLLALGYFTSAAGILRTVYTHGALHPSDLTYTVMDFMIWKTVELPLSIIVGCLPTLRPLFDHGAAGSSSARTSGQVQDDSHHLTGRDEGGGIKQTTSIRMETTSCLQSVCPSNDSKTDLKLWV